MKNFKLSGWILTFIFIPFLCSCEKDEIDCLPYEGEILSASCNGIVVKVTNTHVDSFFEWGGGRVDNAITVRIPNGIGFEEFFGNPIDETKSGQRFYFEFRELLQEEYNFCTMAIAESTRLVFMTKFSLDKCNVDNLIN